MDDLENFRNWLTLTKKLNSRSSKDVVSRLKRVNKICTINEVSSPAEYFSKLADVGAFNVLTVFVRSQLRRSYKLYYEYQKK